MAHFRSRLRWRLGLAGTLTISGLLGISHPALAQLTVDTTLGAENSTVVPNVLIQNVLSDRVDGGALRGINLFHSFLQFNVAAGRGVYFTNPAGVQNILTRVTGGSPSQIFGRLGVLGPANLFLLNPNGIIFGPTASLDVQGSFVASTATAIQIGTGVFSATQPATSTLLSVQPGALFLNALVSQQSGIINQANLTAGQNLSLVAGSVNSIGQLQATGAVNVQAIAGTAIVSNAAGGTVSLAASSDLTIGNVTATNATLSAGNNVLLNGSQLIATGNLAVQAQNGIAIGDNAATPFIAQAGGNLLIQGNQGINFQTLSNPASVFQSGGNLSLTSSGSIAGSGRFISGAALGFSSGRNLALTQSQLNAVGNLTLSAQDTVQLRDSATAPFTAIAGGNLQIRGDRAVDIQTLNNPASLFQSTGSLSLSSNGSVTANAVFDAGGNFAIGSGGDITLPGYTGISLTLSAQGNINIGAIDTSSATGGGGAVSLSARRNITIGSISTFSTAPGVGNGGAVALNSSTGNITIANFIDSSSITGSGGNVSFQAAGTVNVGAIDASSINGSSGTVSAIAGGNITTRSIDASSLGGRGGIIMLSSNNGAINATAGTLDSSSITGNGGNVSLTAKGTINTGAINSSSANGTGGNIRLSSNGGAINTTAGNLDADSTLGNGGSISLAASGNITTGTIDASSINANGGRISLTSSNGAVNTTAGVLNSYTLAGNGGDVSISATSNIVTGNIFAFSDDANGGDIRLTSSNGFIDTTAGELQSYVRTTTGGSGGQVSLLAANNIRVGDIRSDGGQDASGDIIVVSNRGGTIDIADRTIVSSTFGSKTGGNIFIQTTANGNVSIARTSITSTVQPNASGNGGSILIGGGSVSLNDVDLDTSTSGAGRGGNIFVTGSNNGPVSITNSRISTTVQPSATGHGGNIGILGGSVSLDNSFINSGTEGGGNSGNIAIQANKTTISLINGSTVNSDTRGTGSGGNINLTAPSISFNSGRVSARTLGSGAGGNVSINADKGSLALANSSSISTAVDSSTATGKGGGINVTARSVSLTAGSRLEALTRGAGAAGDIRITASQIDVSGADNAGNYSGLQTSSEAGSTSPGGNIIINSSRQPQGSLRVADGGFLSARTRSNFAGGNIEVNSNRVELIGGGQLIASASGSSSGAAGSITVNATQGVTISGKNSRFSLSSANPNESEFSGLFAQSRGSGSAGNLTINTPQLQMQDGAQATVSSTGTGSAGNLNVNARFVTLNNSSKLSAETVSGSGGNIQLRNLETLQLNNNSQISASTETGQGGTLSINASRFISLNNRSGLFARATGTGFGTAGNLVLSTRLLTVQNDSEISTSANQGNAGQILAQANSFYLGSGGRVTSRSDGAGNAGSITIQLSDLLRLNRGEISASSEKGGGGNITISARDIELKNSSLISTRVSSGSGGGGNISITARDLFIALEDSDILANAEDGVGGRIEIKAPVFIADLFATVGQNPGRDFSRFRGNGQVDISASSRFGVSGVVNIPDFSFLQNSLDRLSENFVSTEQIVAGSCLARRNAVHGSFVIAGTGGLPNDPYSLIRSQYRVMSVQSIGDSASRSSKQPMQEFLPLPTPKHWKPGDRVQEAQGFMKTVDGRIVLGTDAQLAAIAKAQEIICSEEESKTPASHL